MSVFATDAALANCTPADNARLNAIGRHQKVLEARMRRGDCSVHPEYIRISRAGIAILRDSERRPGCWVKWKRRTPEYPGCIGRSTTTTAKTAPEKAAPAKTQERTASQPPAEPGKSASNAGSCSDISGLGGSGPSNCTPSTGVPANAQAQIDQAKSYMQAARTVKQSDPTYTGWAAAAAQFRKAATAFQAAGDAAQAQAANEQAQTLEDALKIADQKAGQTAAQIPSAQSVPGVGTGTGDANSGANSGNSFNIPTPCEDLTGKYGCRDGGRIEMRQARALNSGQTETLNRPRPWRGYVAPDVQAEIFALAAQIIDKANGAAPNDPPATDALVVALQRRLAAHRVPVRRKDLACLQPTSGTSPRLQDNALRWKPEHIKKEAIDRSGLCDGVAEGDAKEACREEKYGQAVMWAEPELAGQCRTAELPNQELEAVAACAKRRFLAAWANNKGIAPPPTPDSWTMAGSCNAATPAARKETLRDILRRRLSEIDDEPNAEKDRAAARQQSASAPEAADTPPPSPPPAVDADEAYCDYMARQVARGELTPGGATAIPSECKATIAAAEALKAKQKADGDKPFTMNAEETDAEIRRLLGKP